MSEMLGNHYFLARDYAAAIREYRTAFKRSIPKNIEKKIIICYLTQNNFETAMHHFQRITKEDPLTIINTDFTTDECPCMELINGYEKENDHLFEEIIRLGILWSYCDISRAIKYFRDSLDINPENKFVQETLDILNKIKNRRGSI
jgi:tetratricopeptide (TPR) repeat protein